MDFLTYSEAEVSRISMYLHTKPGPFFDVLTLRYLLPPHISQRLFGFADLKPRSVPGRTLCDLDDSPHFWLFLLLIFFLFVVAELLLWHKCNLAAATTTAPRALRRGAKPAAEQSDEDSSTEGDDSAGGESPIDESSRMTSPPEAPAPPAMVWPRDDSKTAPASSMVQGPAEGRTASPAPVTAKLGKAAAQSSSNMKKVVPKVQAAEPSAHPVKKVELPDGPAAAAIAASTASAEAAAAAALNNFKRGTDNLAKPWGPPAKRTPPTTNTAAPSSVDSKAAAGSNGLVSQMPPATAAHHLAPPTAAAKRPSAPDVCCSLCEF